MMKGRIRNGLVQLLSYFACVFMSYQAVGQTGLTENFNNNVLSAGWAGSANYTLSEVNQELSVQASVPSGWHVFSYSFSALDLSVSPYLKINVKSSSAFQLRIDFEDVMGRATNNSAISLSVQGSGNYQTLTYGFAGRFSQSWPTAATVDQTQIVRVVIFVNPGGTGFTGTFTMDDLLIGTDTGILPPAGDIRLNQLGFYPNAPKTAVVVSAPAGSFYIVSANKQDTLYTGTLSAASTFSLSGEMVRRAVFTDFKTIGSYFLTVPGIGYSHPFRVKADIHHEVSKAGLKSFYYQRASQAIVAPYANGFPRALGHPDNVVYVHNSAANSYRPANTIISCPRGWYDAGDYNKYLATAGFSTFFLLSMYEHYATYFDTLNLSIPESNNTIPDVLDEALWEIRWMLTMQDPFDGGVYFKLTCPNFDGTDMPNDVFQQRYVVQKSTSSTLDFSATMAQAARIFKLYNTQLPGLADSCINASVKAWNWARRNPSVPYIQSALSNPIINTGEYGDNNFSDEFQWAGMELYATTKIDSFYTLAGSLTNINVPGWADERALGYFSLSHLRKNLTPISDTTNIKQRILNQANSLVSSGNVNPYATAMNFSWNFIWGSSGIAATQGAFLLQAFDMSKDSAYLRLAIANLDYLLGRNSTNYSFVTGYGNVTPMDIHHRISAADGIADPIPGLLAGGPNNDYTADCGSASYPSSFDARSYLDAYCSYSTNEVAINWNAPFAYLSNVIEAIESGATTSQLPYVPVLPTDLSVLSVSDETSVDIRLVEVMPNPAREETTISFTAYDSQTSLSLLDGKGQMVFSKVDIAKGQHKIILPLSELAKGLYLIQIKNAQGVSSKKLIVE